MASTDLAQRLLAAELALAAGDIDRSRSVAEQVETLARQRADKRALGWALLLRARSHHLYAQYSAAYSTAFEASALLRASGDIARALRAQNTLVAVHRENQDLMRAAEQARIGIDMAVAHGEHEMTVRLLHSLARVLHSGGDFPEAIRCLQQALALHAQRPEVLANHQQRCATDLAWARLNYGEQLALQGQRQASEVQLRAAKVDLPAQATVQADNALDAIACLAQRVHLQAVWQQRQGARGSAAALLKLARRHGPQRQLAVAMQALSTLHLCAGQPRRAIHQQLRCLGIWRQMDFSAAIHSSRQGLADLYARTGAYGAALLWQHEAVVARAQTAREQAALRARVAQLERQAGRRHSLAHELLGQGQRTLVLGRLIGHLSQALVVPAQRSHQRIEQTQIALQNHADAVRVLAPLQHALRQLDLAAALAQQLKLFSFRAAPQGNVLLLEEALQTAWEGLRLYGRLQGWSLGVVEPSRSTQPLEARADAQRLGILLKALLIGMTQPQMLSSHARQERGQVLWAQISCAQPGEISLSLGVSGHHGLSTGDGDAYALCVELAHEMGGQLSAEMDGTLMRCHKLMLPRASSALNALGAEPSAERPL
jgi:tetratricopeptide (TPR) repeat protein